MYRKSFVRNVAGRKNRAPAKRRRLTRWMRHKSDKSRSLTLTKVRQRVRALAKKKSLVQNASPFSTISSVSGYFAGFQLQFRTLLYFRKIIFSSHPARASSTFFERSFPLNAPQKNSRVVIDAAVSKSRSSRNKLPVRGSFRPLKNCRAAALRS